MSADGMIVALVLGPIVRPIDRKTRGDARRIVAAIRAVRGIATEDIGLIDSLIREARILADNCAACGKTGRMGAGRCVICGPMRSILAKLEGKAGA